MKNALEILEAVEAAKGKDKLRILAANKDNKDLQLLLDAAFNFNRRYYINKFEFEAKGDKGISVSEFMEVLKKLEGGLRGKEAVTLVQSILNASTPVQAKWYAKVIRRDLKAGFGLDMSLEAGFNIPSFEVQLAKDMKRCKRIASYFDGSVKSFASTKLDGYRCFAVIQDGDVMMLTRNGNIFQNFPKIQEELKKAFPTGNWCLDGEIMSDDFSAMQQSAFAVDRGTTVGDVRYFIFDMVPFEEWRSKHYVTTASVRYLNLEREYNKRLIDNMNFCLVQHHLVKTQAEFMVLYEKFLTRGFEGIMLNRDEPYYEGKVSNKMLKLKPDEEMDAKVLDVFPGEKGSKYDGTLGGFIILQENKVKGKVGTGIKDEERDAIWKNPRLVIGRTIKIKYQEVTKDGALRFPRVVEFRFDKAVR